MSNNPTRQDEEHLQQLLDGRLSGPDKAHLEQRIRTEPELERLHAAMLAQHQALRELHRGILEQTIPAHLLGAGARLDQEIQGLHAWRRWGGMAAMLLLSFGLGWLSHPASQETSEHAMRVSAPFGQQAALAHAVFAPEVRHPVEVDSAQQEHLVQWLSKRLNRPLKLPVLSPQGFELLGGRLLSSDAGARAQFMYQNAAGQRLTLYVGALDAAQGSPSTLGTETAFLLSGKGALSTFYWVDQGFGYALSGPLTPDALRVLTQAVYHQLM